MVKPCKTVHKEFPSGEEFNSFEFSIFLPMVLLVLIVNKKYIAGAFLIPKYEDIAPH